ncbi:MAG TPA: hypothetical protein VD816_15060 [Ohtaekwangia sp.]|nr:hypothetical protein [Ohtaekwangia sp.]
MGKLTQAQREELRAFLVRQGLSFKPLQDEMFDHMSCDLEDRMSDGSSFHDAWHQSVAALPDNHFQNIQQDVMETINKQFTVSKGLSFAALGLLLISVVFKVLHLQFSGELLLVSFGLMAVALLTTSLSGISLNREKKGTIGLLAVVFGIIILMAGFSFKILHLPGADVFVITAVIVLIASLLANTLYVYQHASGKGNLLTFLHEKYTPGIERFLLLLLIPLAVYKMFTLVTGSSNFVGGLILLVVIYGAGLQLIAMSWRIMEKQPTKRNSTILIATIISFVCMTLPYLGPLLPVEARIAIIVVFNITASWLACNLDAGPRKVVPVILAIIVPIVFTSWAFIRLGFIPLSASVFFFNLPLLFLLVAGVFLTSKHGTMRAFMLISLAAYIFEYIR